MWFEYRLKDNLLDSEANETDRFYQECEIDPTIADKISIIRRSYQNKKNVSFLQVLFTILIR